MAKSKTPNNKDTDVETSDVKDERNADLSVSSRERLRHELEDEVEAFLASGGKIHQVDANVTADPPQKPQNNYCSRPI